MAVVYHWKHGWIPLDHTAALSKAKGNHAKATQMLSEAHGPDAGIRSRQDVAKAALDLPNVPATHRSEARDQLHSDAARVGAADLLPGHGVEYRQGNTPNSVTAHRNGVRIGELAWHSEKKHVTWAAVYDEQDRRKGVASGMFAKARSIDPRVRHQTDPEGLTESGAAFARSGQLAEAGAAKRAEAQRAADAASTGDRAAGRLGATGLAQAGRNTDRQLSRYIEATAEAKRLDFKAGLARAREAEAARAQLTHADLIGAKVVRDKFGWYEVVKVNQKTVTVKTATGTETIAIGKILQAK